MKRTNVILDEEKAKEVKNLLGADSISAAINMALEETLKTQRIRKLADFFGKGVWDGDLAEMRGDTKPGSPKGGKKRRA